jgi:hypothetical protein
MSKKPQPSVDETYAVCIARDTLTGVAFIEDWELDGKPHRVGGPAHIERNRKTGQVTFEMWIRNDLIHRDDGPATVRYSDTGRVIRSSWYTDGKKSIPKPTRPPASGKAVGHPGPSKTPK